MRIYDDLTPALRAMLKDWSMGYQRWITPFALERGKLDALGDKWAEVYGTRLPAHTRRYRHSKNLPTACGYAAPIPGITGKARCLLLARLPSTPSDTPWSREKWRSDPLVFDDYVIVREQNAAREWHWTWKLQDRVLGIWEQDLLRLVKVGDAAEVTSTTYHAIRYWPLFGGVRRQLKRSIRSASKLWHALKKMPWPGPDPEKLPSIGEFRQLDAVNERKLVP